MALDLYFEREKEEIGHQEEDLFQLVNDDERFPALNWLWEEFYNDPRISPEIASKLVQELILLQHAKKPSSQISNTISKLLLFLGKAYKSNSEIRCVSD